MLSLVIIDERAIDKVAALGPLRRRFQGNAMQPFPAVNAAIVSVREPQRERICADFVHFEQLNMCTWPMTNHGTMALARSTRAPGSQVWNRERGVTSILPLNAHDVAIAVMDHVDRDSHAVQE